MFPITFFPDLPDCSIEQVSSTQETIIISLSSTREGATCPGCGEFSSRVHSTSTRSRHVTAFGWPTSSPSASGAKVSLFSAELPAKNGGSNHFLILLLPMLNGHFPCRISCGSSGRQWGARLEHG